MCVCNVRTEEEAININIIHWKWAELGQSKLEIFSGVWNIPIAGRSETK